MSVVRLVDVFRASTGPPPRGGGNCCSPFRTALRWPVLQRGRPRAGAEIWSLSDTAERLSIASTGPPPRGGGNFLPNHLTGWLRYCFNGAAPARGRKSIGRVRGHTADSCFNGAAPARGRKCGHGIAGSVVELLLQRGRPRAGAEMALRAVARRQLSLLQRGRPRAGAEIWDKPPAGTGSARLQRGRPRAGAEIRTSHCYWEKDKCCFNGAAPARGRKLQHQRTAARSCHHASTGPPPRGGGNLRGPANQTVGSRASTGPPPRGGGNNPAASARNTRCRLRFNGAAPARGRKSDRRHLGNRHQNSFNGAAPARGRKFGRTPTYPTIPQAASTGPPPRGGGNPFKSCQGIAFAMSLQRGRPRAGAEIILSSQSVPTMVCFNGAAPARGRKLPFLGEAFLSSLQASTGPPPRGGGNP